MIKTRGQFSVTKKRLIGLSLTVVFIAVLFVFAFFPKQNSQATLPVDGTQIKIGQVAYRTYNPSDTATPGSPLANSNSPATLQKPGDNFRLRVAMQNKGIYTKAISEHSLGYYHNCGIMSDEKIYCWGEGEWGALGTNSTTNVTTPTPVDDSGALNGKKIIQVATGDFHTCALDADGKAYCWGYGLNGENGNGVNRQENAPVAVDTTGVLAGKKLTQIATGLNHNCAVDTEGAVYCWGENKSGELGNGSTTKSAAPVSVSMQQFSGKKAKQVAVGLYYSCAVTTDGSVYCWGTVEGGRVPTGYTSGNYTRPIRISFGSKKIAEISANSLHACGVTDNYKEVYCWGKNDQGQLGDGTTTDRNKPVLASAVSSVIGSSTIKQLRVSHDHTCILLSNNEVYCWGAGAQGQLANGSTSGSQSPVKVTMPNAAADNTIVSITAGSQYSCAVTSRGHAYCWGVNAKGQLGNGWTTNSLTPTSLSISGARTITPSAIKLRAEYAKKTGVAACSAVDSGSWQPITSTSKVAYSSSGPSDGTTITTNANDPPFPNDALGVRPQTIVRKTDASAVFTNTRDIAPSEVAFWDLALADRGLDRDADYCIRLAIDTDSTPGSSFDLYSVHPEIKTAPGSLDIRFTDAAGTTLANPVTKFNDTISGRNGATTNGLLANANSQQIEVFNTQSSAGWNAVLSATAGSTARWQQAGGSGNYSFNSTDAQQGSLLAQFSSASIATAGDSLDGSTCDTTGIQKGTDGQFKAGTSSANSITLMSGSGSSKLGCAFRLRNVQLQQQIPAYQSPGVYNLPMTLTVTAQ